MEAVYDDSWRFKAIQVTKYNPAFRKDGKYSKDEWIDYSCIGDTYEGKIFTYEEYLCTEEKYIEAAMAFLQFYECIQVQVQSLEKYTEIEEFQERDKGNFNLYEQIQEGSIISLEELPAILRLILRTYMWCELIGNNKQVAVRFGYDYYMYFNVEDGKFADKLAEEIEQMGLYIEY